MGHELYRMILGGAPASWTTAMRLVALVIADDARDPSQGMPENGGPWSGLPAHGYSNGDGEWKDGLAERTGLSERAISRALTDLARADYEMREQLGTDCRGRPVFAVKGRAPTYRVPRLAPRDSAPMVAGNVDLTPGDSATKVAENVDLGGRKRRPRAPKTSTHSPQIPPISSSDSE